MVAPTRADLDRAHGNGWWLDVGVPRFRNLLHVAHGHTFLWLCLSLSSIPFHLFYNSAVFYKTAVPAYNVYAGQGSLGQMNWSDLSLINGGDHGYWSSDDEPPFKELFDAARNGNLIRLDSAACIETFAKTYQTSYANVLLATEDLNKTSYAIVHQQPVFQPSMSGHGVMSAYKWLCPSDKESQAICQEKGIFAVKTWATDNNWKVSVQSDLYLKEKKMTNIIYLTQMGSMCYIVWQSPCHSIAAYSTPSI